MPTATYQNLPSPKRARLERAARVEFATHDFHAARLDRIARRARVPKGSLYQYFDDKEELYVHTVRVAMDDAWRMFEVHVERVSPSNCLELLREAMLHMSWLANHEPHLATLYARVVFAQDVHAKGRLYSIYTEHSDAFYERLIPWGVETGHIDPSLPPDVVRFLIHAVGGHVQYVLLTGDAPAWMRPNTKRMTAFVDQLIERVSLAIAPRRPPRKPPARRKSK